MPADRPYPVGTRLRRKADGLLGTVILTHYGYGVRWDEEVVGEHYGDNLEDHHHLYPEEWEPADPKDRPVKGICKFLRKLELRG